MPKNLKTILLNSAIWGVIYVVLNSGFQYLRDRGNSQPPQALARALPAAIPACGPLPSLGTTSILDGGTLQRENVQYGALAIKNDQPVTVVAILADASMTRRYQAITVGAGSETQVQVPSGHYGLGIMSGRTWCSLDRGFTDGTKHSVNGGVTVKPDSTIQTIVGTGAAPGEISLLYRNQYRTEEFREGGLEVRQSLRGYITSGTINGKPVSFMIDTGASQVALPAWLAEQAGIRCTRSAQYSTSAGSVTGCNGTAAEVSFGPFRLQDVEVAVISGAENVLLGMDVLRRFNMVWRGDAVRITSLDAVGQLPGSSPSKSFAPVVPWIAPAPPSALFVPPVAMTKHDDGKFQWFGDHWLTLLAAFIGVAWAAWRQRKNSPASPKPKSKNDYYYNPKEFRAERPSTPPPRPQTAGTPQSRLLLACGGDKARMVRLMEYETRKAPFITDSEAATRAIDRIERDRQ